MKTYEALTHRDGRWWIITVPELNAVTQARKVRDVERIAAGLVEALLDLEEGTVHVEVEMELPDSVASTWHEAEVLQERADRDAREAAELRMRAVCTLLDREHLTQVEAGALLGISYQRVQELARAWPSRFGDDPMPPRV